MDLDSNENNQEKKRENETTALQTKQQKAEQTAAVPVTISSNGITKDSCGYGALCHPRWLQFFYSAKWFLVFMCLIILLQNSLVYGYLSSVLPTIEKRYGLKSAETGLIHLGFDIGSLLVVVFVSYFGGKGHRPRWIGIGAVFMAIGAGLFSTPQFFSSPYEIPKVALTDIVHKHLCLNQSVTNSSLNNTQCEAQNVNSGYIPLFVIAVVLMGMGAAPIYPLGITFIYDNGERHTSSMYIAIVYIMSGVGPPLGYVLGGMLTGYYVDLGVEGVPSSDPRFIGAWWSGFVLFAALILPSAIPFLGYPQKLPQPPSQLSSGSSPVTDDNEEDMKACMKCGKNLKDLLRASISLLTNPTYLCVTAAGILELSTAAAVLALVPKYMPTEFSIDPFQSNILIYLGIVLLPSLAGGILIGGYVIKHFRLNKTECARFGMICIIACFFVLLVALFIHCPASDFMGIDESCMNCNCESTLYNPICLKNVNFYNPCTAGCSDVLRHDNGTQIEPITYTGCDCDGLNITATPGICDRDCTHTLIPIFACFFFIILASSCALIPGLIVTFRCVKYDERTLAMGLQFVFFRTLGFIPSKIYFRSAIDEVCLIWVGSTDVCEGESDVCQVYNADFFHYIVFGLLLGLQSLSVIFVSIAWYLCRKKDMRNHKTKRKKKRNLRQTKK